MVNQYANPEKYFTEDVMKKLDEAAEQEFMYGQVDSDVSEDISEE
jgi:hypothetical protein